MKKFKNTRDLRAMKEIKTCLAMTKDQMKCPYCGKPMKRATGIMVDSKYATNDIMVCSGYPECDVYCRIAPINGSEFRLISTPADKTLRMLRKQAHFYVNQLVANGVYSSDLEVHKAITNMSLLNKYGLMHIGEMREYACQEAISNLIKILYNNRGRLKFFDAWRVRMNWMSQEITDMKDELTGMFARQTQKTAAHA